jgi:hypothetical protein
MWRKVGRFFTKRSESKLLFLAGCTGDEVVELAGVSGLSIGDLEDAMLDRAPVPTELGEADRLLKKERSTMDGFPA